MRADMEKRSGTDRRNFAMSVNFPLMLEDGTWVTNDRRTNPDRRMEGYCVEFLETSHCVIN
ncbi:MAG: hypothetical protein ACREUA_03080 [Burkholderiales bacterium]